jgi:predicted RNA-binding Zn ribbon-like protein
VIETEPDLLLVERFLNTYDERSFSRHGEIHTGGDQLSSPVALGSWLAGHGLLTTDRSPAGRDPDEGDLRAALALRDGLRRSLSGGTETDDVLAGFPLRLTAEPVDGSDGSGGGLRLIAVSGRPGLDRIVEIVAGSVADGRWARMKLCAASDCRWAFFDTSRSGGGRWCTMAVCGNRAKTRSYRERRQATG